MIVLLIGFFFLGLPHRFIWKRTSFILGHSTTEIVWEIPHDADEGNYRIRHFGAARHILGGFTQYGGMSEMFAVYKGGQQVAYMRMLT